MESPAMRPSRVLKKLRAGDAITCFKVNLGSPQVVEIAARAGFDCVWLCMEHCANDYSFIERGISAAKGCDVDVMVRVSRGSYSDHIRPLELDAAGIMVPHCMGLDDARRIVQMTRFHPIGRRPLDGGNADGGYATIALADYLRQANEQRFVMVQIEDPEPLDELDAIAALPGIDILFFGPADFSQGIGAPGVWDHPRLLDARRRVVEAALRHGKFAGIPASAGNREELLAMGYRFLTAGADVVGLSDYCRSIRAAFST